MSTSPRAVSQNRKHWWPLSHPRAHPYTYLSYDFSYSRMNSFPPQNCRASTVCSTTPTGESSTWLCGDNSLHFGWDLPVRVVCEVMDVRRKGSTA